MDYADILNAFEEKFNKFIPELTKALTVPNSTG